MFFAHQYRMLFHPSHASNLQQADVHPKTHVLDCLAPFVPICLVFCPLWKEKEEKLNNTQIKDGQNLFYNVHLSAVWEKSTHIKTLPWHCYHRAHFEWRYCYNAANNKVIAASHYRDIMVENKENVQNKTKTTANENVKLYFACASACMKMNSHLRENIFCRRARFSAS